MLRTYLLVLEDPLKRKATLDFLDSLREVKNWYAFMPHAVMVISEKTATQLTELYSRRFRGDFFILTEVPRENVNGWLALEAWSYVNHPKSSGRWPSE